MEDKSSASFDYSVRRGEISAYGRALSSSKRLRLLIVLVGIVAISLLVILLVLPWPIPRLQFLIILFVFLVLIVVGLWSIYLYANRNFIEPDLAFRMWLQQVCDGNLNARIGLDQRHRHFKELNFHTRNLASSLWRLSDDMDSLVESQTKKLSEQKRVLELLFNLTADVSSEIEDEAAFVTVCHYVAEWFESARVSCYRVVDGNDVLRCVATRCSDGSGNAPTSIAIIENNGIGVVTLDRVPTQISTFESDGASSSGSLAPLIGPLDRP